MAHDEFVVAALPDQFFLAAMLEPHHRTAYPAFVDEGEFVLQIRPAVQVKEFGRAQCVGSRQRVGGNIVYFRVADPDTASVIERPQIMLARSQHPFSPLGAFLERPRGRVGAALVEQGILDQ